MPSISVFYLGVKAFCFYMLHKFYQFSFLKQHVLFSTQTCHQGIELICQKQEFVKSSIESKWNLAEAQQKLGSLALHNSESMDQECAKAQMEASELRQREEEWRRKEEALIERERQNLWNTDSFSKEVFNKVCRINVYEHNYKHFIFHLFLILSVFYI